MIEEEPPDEQHPEPPAAESPAQDASREPAAPTEESHAGETAAAAAPPVAEEPIAAEEPPAVAGEPPVAEGPPAAEEPPAVEEGPAVAEEPPAVEEAVAAEEPSAAPREAPAPDRAKPAIPGADLEVDIVPEGSDPLAREQALAEFEEDVLDLEPALQEAPPPAEAALPQATIDLASDARYIATGKRKTAVARVILKPGAGEYTINGKDLNHHFPRPTAQRNIRQPLETVGYESRMDVVAKLHGGGISAQAGALRHGIARALIEADPNLRSELKRRGFLTRDSRAKERRKAGLKKARKKPQFSKR